MPKVIPNAKPSSTIRLKLTPFFCKAANPNKMRMAALTMMIVIVMEIGPPIIFQMTTRRGMLTLATNTFFFNKSTLALTNRLVGK